MGKRETSPKKFKVGDRVKVVAVQPGCEDKPGMGRYLGKIGVITGLTKYGYYHISCDDGTFVWAPEWLEAYGEPEAKDEAKELNLLEILKGCEGMEIYSPIFGYRDISLNEYEDEYPVEVAGMTFTKDGRYADQENAAPMIFPSRELYEKYPIDAKKAWQEWREVQNSIITIDCAGANFDAELAFKGIADRDKCLEEIKAIIEKYRKKCTE